MKRINLIILLFVLGNFITSDFIHAEKNAGLYREFTSSNISLGLFNYIISVLRPGETLLELGSGWCSGLLSKYIIVYSVEHDRKWLNRFASNYIYAPIKGKWYDPEVLKTELPETYHMILIDGPPAWNGKYSRDGFLHNIELFNTNVIIILDDVQREAEYNMLLAVADLLGRNYSIYTSNSCNGKKFGVIFPKRRAE